MEVLQNKVTKFKEWISETMFQQSYISPEERRDKKRKDWTVPKIWQTDVIFDPHIFASGIICKDTVFQNSACILFAARSP